MFILNKVGYEVDRKGYPVFVVNNFMHDWGINSSTVQTR